MNLWVSPEDKGTECLWEGGRIIGKERLAVKQAWDIMVQLPGQLRTRETTSKRDAQVL
jgi:hypothetical protein